MQSHISAARLEGAEAEFMYQYESMAPRSAVTSLGIVTARIDRGVVLSMRNDVTGYWNKALGFGFAEPVTRDLIDRVIDFYKSERSPRAVLQIAPEVVPTNWDEICRSHDIREDSRWFKLTCSVDHFRPIERTTLRVGPVGPDDVDAWARTTLRGFGMPVEGLAEMFASECEHSNFPPVCRLGRGRDRRHRQSVRRRRGRIAQRRRHITVASEPRSTVGAHRGARETRHRGRLSVVGRGDGRTRGGRRQSLAQQPGACGTPTAVRPTELGLASRWVVAYRQTPLLDWGMSAKHQVWVRVPVLFFMADHP
jgi:hypothetical protein